MRFEQSLFISYAHLECLGRYTHRIAISNARLVSLVDGVLRFRWQDYADRGHTKIMALDVDEFLRRFLLHVLPRGGVRSRHFGLLATGQRRSAIRRARHLLDAPAPRRPLTTSLRLIPITPSVPTVAKATGRSWRSSGRSRPARARPLAAGTPGTS